MLKLTAIMLCLTTACVDNATTNHPLSPADCGPLPSRGHYAVTYAHLNHQELAVLTRKDFDALTQERHDLKAWALCVGGEP